MSSNVLMTLNLSRMVQNKRFWLRVLSAHRFSSVRFLQKSMNGVDDVSTWLSLSMERLNGICLLRLSL